MTKMSNNKKKQFDKFVINSSVIRLFLFVSTIANLVVTPVVFIHYSTINNLGYWTLILSVGSFATILDFGLIQVMTTASIQAVAKKATEEAGKILNILLNYLIHFLIIIFLLLLTINVAFGWVWKIEEHGFLLLASLCFLNFSFGTMVRYFEGAFRALENLLGLKVLVGISYLDLIILLSNTIKGETFTTIMLQMIVAKVTLILTLAFCFQKQHKIFKFMTLAEAISGVKEYQKRGISILGMPLGYLVINEASNVAVASILGLEMLGIFTVLKSLGGIFRQVSGIFTLSMMPKFTELITMQKFEIARKNLSNLKNFLIAVNSFILIILLSLFNVFSNNISKLELVGFNVYTIFLISAFLDIWWIIDSTILVSINQHQNLTVRFLFSASLGFLIGCSLMIQIGVSGMAIGTLVIDLALIPYSLRRKNTILKADHSE